MRLSLSCLLLAACSSGSSRGPDADGDADADADTDADGDADTDADADGDGGPNCVNLQCRQDDCDGAVLTRLTGTVLAPTLESPDPVPGVTVYVPNSAVQPFSEGVECTTCDAVLSGSPLVQTTTALDGTFVLEDVPSGEDVPVVVQLGRWRRQLTVDVTPCADTAIPVQDTQLPRSSAQGDIPHMALVTGSHDALECTLAKILDVAEITAPDGGGRVHLYRQTGNDMATPLPARSALVADIDVLRAYDAVLLPCPSHEAYSDVEAANLHTYADEGGRVFNTHGGGFWMFEPVDLYAGMVAWNNQPDPSVRIAEIDTTFEKGATFADWLDLVGATSEHARIPLGAPQWFVDSVNPPAQRWVYTIDEPTIQHFTFNTPLGQPEDARCGRVLFSNFHVSSSQGTAIFPDTCVPGPLTPDEQIIEYMLFDVTACVTPDAPF